MKARELFEIGARHQLEHPLVKLGPATSYSLARDPKHMAFVLSRYKFVSKMLEGARKLDVLEVGAGDGFGLPIVAKVVRQVDCIDWEPISVNSINDNLIEPGWISNATSIVLDINIDPPPDKMYDAIYHIDFIEHIDPENESLIMNKLLSCLKDDGMMIVGTPNKDASHLASDVSEVQHINLYGANGLLDMMHQYFKNVLLFGMNDEVLHTGYYPMCHYLWAIGIGKE